MKFERLKKWNFKPNAGAGETQETQLHFMSIYRKTYNRRGILVGNKLVDHSDVVGASPVGAAPTTFSFCSHHMASIYRTNTTARTDENHFGFLFGATYIRNLTVRLSCTKIWYFRKNKNINTSIVSHCYIWSKQKMSKHGRISCSKLSKLIS